MIPTPTKGFSLIETLIAITILAVALVGPFIAVRTALQASYVARDQLVASMLAQEAMEYIRNVRDNNFHAGRDWLHGFDDPARDACLQLMGTAPPAVCVVDVTRGDFHTDSSGMTEATNIGTAQFMRISSANLYNQQPITATNPSSRFKRTLVIRTNGPAATATETRVIVTVTWVTLGRNYTITVSDVIRDWI